MALIPIGEHTYLTVHVPRKNHEQGQPEEFLLLGDAPVKLSIGVGGSIRMSRETRRQKENEKVTTEVEMITGETVAFTTEIDRDPLVRMTRTTQYQKNFAKTTVNVNANHPDRSRIDGMNLSRTKTIDDKGIHIYANPSISVLRAEGYCIGIIGDSHNRKVDALVDEIRVAQFFMQDGVEMTFEDFPDPS